ncbi:hypothetical protein I5I37_10985 [Pseudomonas aeruginosa]|nr:hypothetical protein [Pseudomonas aeruginosa]
MSNLLLSPLAVGNLALRNRIVMAPMTRSRAQHVARREIWRGFAQ